MKYRSVVMLVILLMPIGRVTAQDFLISSTEVYADGTSSPFNRVQPGDTVWLQSGVRNKLRLANFHGQPGKPVVFANLDGQVIVETDYNYGISFSACSDFKLAGLAGNGYKYGIHIARVSNPSGMGISATNKSTDLEIENCEISNTGFAGIITKTDPSCDDPGTWRNGFTQYNTVIHDCYIHDTDGEGIYAGDTHYTGMSLSGCNKTVLPSVLVGTKIYNNRIERTGYDGLQISSAVIDCEIHHNTLKDCGYRMVRSQTSSILIGGGTQAKCYNNTIIDSYATAILVFGKGGTTVFNNLIIRPGLRYLPDNPDEPESGIFLSDKTNDEKTFYGVYNNTIVRPKSDGIRIDNSVNFTVRIFNNAIIDPGAFHHYETDNTDRTGMDSYIYDTGRLGLYESSNNFFTRLVTDGVFANSGSDDFHLMAGSPMIDAGMNLIPAGVTTDLDDRQRPAGTAFDIGAYEYPESQSIDQHADDPGFFVSSLRVDPDKTINFSLSVKNDLSVDVRLVDIQGRIIFEKQNLKVNSGDKEFSLPAGSGGMVILMIQSDRSSYVRKIIFF